MSGKRFIPGTYFSGTDGGKQMEARVTVAIQTYNLEKYIAAALDSILEQKTNFPFKILVADDASTDRTTEILKQYQEKYPQIIELILADKNGGSSVDALRLYKRLNTEYFAWLDGDDLWTNENRLQHQVDFLDNNKQFTMCSGQTYFLQGETVGNPIVPERLLGKAYGFADHFLHPVLFHVSGLLYRNIIFSREIPQCYYDCLGTFEDCALRGEDFRRVIHLERGPLYVLPEKVSYYRIHENGLWTGMAKEHKALENAISANFFRKYYGSRYAKLRPQLQQQADQAYQNMWATLVNGEYVFPEYKLSVKDTQLLTDYLSDIAKEKNFKNLIGE